VVTKAGFTVTTIISPELMWLLLCLPDLSVIQFYI